jgi:hypothetical protein
METDSMPYLVLSRKVEGKLVYAAMSLMDHTLLGIAYTRDEAVARLMVELADNHGDHWRYATAEPAFIKKPQ